MEEDEEGVRFVLEGNKIRDITYQQSTSTKYKVQGRSNLKIQRFRP